MSAIAITCSTRSAGKSVRRQFGSALEWFIVSADWLAAITANDRPGSNRYVTLQAGDGDALEIAYSPSRLETTFDELEEVCAELFGAALDRAASAVDA